MLCACNFVVVFFTIIMTADIELTLNKIIVTAARAATGLRRQRATQTRNRPPRKIVTKDVLPEYDAARASTYS